MKRSLTVAIIAVAQLGLVAAGVHPQLSARLTGDSYAMRVQLVDPIDPLRGAYVALDYPDLSLNRWGATSGETDRNRGGDVYLLLRRRGEVWEATDWSRERPSQGPYLACDDRTWQVRCGIESFFLPQDEAADAEDLLREGAIAQVHIDGRGNAAVVDVHLP